MGSPRKDQNFANIFAHLEGMGDDDGLFDGLDDEDVYTPPYVKHEEAKFEQDEQNDDKNESEGDFEKIVDQRKTQPIPGANTDENGGSSQNAFDSDMSSKKKVTRMKTQSLRMGADKIYDPQLEIAKLKEELRIKNSEIDRLTFQINKTRPMALMGLDGTAAKMQISSYHFAFMFSSPLVRKLNTNISSLVQLDYQTEIKNIEKQLKKVKHEIRYKVNVATIENFRSVIADAPFALHFTGHGVKNDQAALGPSYLQHKDKGDILLLEDENGMADYLFESDLKKLVELSKANQEYSYHYEVVFVSSCHSEFTAKIFLSTGAKHVICINQDDQISDRASLKFSQVFYEYLFIKKYSVCEAYNLAKEDIRTCINQGEANKFLLFKSEKGDAKKGE